MNETVSETSTLPTGWVKTTVGNIIEPSKERFDPINNTNRTFIGLEHIESNTGKIIEKGNSKELTSTKTIFRSGDVLYGRLRPYLNKACVPSFDGVCSTDILVFQKQPFLSNKFIALFLITNRFVTYANANMTGIQHPRISFKNIAKFLIFLPPYNEQKRIVSKIESIFTQIDGARTRLEAASGMLNKLRISVLRQAFEGSLVPQDPNDAPVEVILKRIRRASEKELVFEKDNLPNGWIASSVGQLYKIVGGGTPSTRVEKYWNGDISWISSADIHGLYDIRPRRKITLEAIKNSATNLVPAGSIIVVTRVGLGKIARTSTPLCFSQDSQALIGSVSSVNPDYMLYYLSQAVQSFKHAGRGTTISGVTKKQLSDLLLSVAPPNEQKRIVSKIESIFTLIDAVERYIESTLRLLDLLKNSTLKQAFEGKLVPQDPDDEPAEFLLQIMKKEKQLIKSQNPSYGRKNVR